MAELKIYSSLDKKLEFEILDQTPTDKNKKGRSDDYNPTREIINKKLSTIIDNFTDVCGFTLTLNKKYHNDDDKYVHRHIQDALIKSRVWKDKKYFLFPEYTKKGILHYHGVMWDEYQIEVMRCVKWWRRKYGFVKPELELKHPYKWIAYITKNYGKTGLWTISHIYLHGR